MSLVRIGFLICSGGTAIAALVASIYWYLSSRPAPNTTDHPVASVSDNPAEHILSAQVNIISIHSALIEASRLNKKAAIWSAVAALFGTFTTVLGALVS